MIHIHIGKGTLGNHSKSQRPNLSKKTNCASFFICFCRACKVREGYQQIPQTLSYH